MLLWHCCSSSLPGGKNSILWLKNGTLLKCYSEKCYVCLGFAKWETSVIALTFLKCSLVLFKFWSSGWYKSRLLSWIWNWQQQMIFADLSFAVFAKSFQLFSEVKLICSFYIYIYFFKMFGTSTSFKVLKVDFFKLSRFISLFFFYLGLV